MAGQSISLQCAICSRAVYEDSVRATVMAHEHLESVVRAQHFSGPDAGLGSMQFMIVEFESYKIIAFRGTNITESDDVGFCLDRDMVEAPFGYGKVMEGFSDYAHISFGIIMNEIVSDGKAIYFCGHSLGGAAAVVSGMQFHRLLEDRLHGVYSFGCPRVGDRRFSRMCNELFRHHRFVNANDIIPLVPALTIRFKRLLKLIPIPVSISVDHHHSGTLRYFTTKGVHQYNPFFFLTFIDRYFHFHRDIIGWFRGKYRDHSMDSYLSLLRNWAATTTYTE